MNISQISKLQLDKTTTYQSFPYKTKDEWYT